MLVYFALILTVMLGFCGLAVDVGMMEVRTVQLQSAADAGALGAATEVAYGDQNGLQQAAEADIATFESLNGIANTAPDTITIATAVSDYSTLTVTVSENIPTAFMGILSSANSTVKVTASATAMFPPCMFFMGTPNLNMGFNSLNTEAYEVASAGTDGPLGCPVYSKSGYSIDYFARVAGMQIKASGPQSATYQTGSVSVPILYNVPAMSDPLAYVTAPTVASTCTNAQPLSYTASVTLTPGTYCGKTVGSTTTPAVTVSGASTNTSGAPCTSTPVVTLQPGLYIFAGGITLNCVKVSGTGATLYLTNYPSKSIGYGNFYLWSSTWNVSAPTTSSLSGLPGIVLMNERNWSGGNQDFQVMYSTWYGDGALYLNGTGLYSWQSSFSAPDYFNIVAANMYQYNGELRPSMNYASLPAGNPLHTVVNLVQ